MTPPWRLKAKASVACVESKGVSCRMCQEACEAGAILFRPQIGGGTRIEIDEARCTGCGSCAPTCPVSAFTIAAREIEMEVIP